MLAPIHLGGANMNKSKYETVLDQIYVGMRDEETAAEVTQYINELHDLVRFIATDWVEMSHDKVRWQRDDWLKKALELYHE